MTKSTETFQLSTTAAELYESKFVPALFAEWAPHLVEIAGVGPGQAVLDVACGTGIVARTAADRLAGAGRVVGVDLNQAMLTVARRVRPDIEWRQGDGGALPFPDASFDRVLCQMALMFFPDRTAALREMRRVARPGATVAVVVPGRLDAQPAYRPFVEMAARHAGPDAATLLGAYFACGDLAELRALVESAGLPVDATRTRLGHARFDSVDAFVAAEVESTPLITRIGADVYDRIREGARDVLRPFTAPDGRVAVPLEGHLVAARR
ncbi:MAG TPA: methyltransferase domain-containing protein [Methylomirabilota bacterium]|jgi:ubiquinone/menaquinone biosynthesis C-methylase UbiE